MSDRPLAPTTPVARAAAVLRGPARPHPDGWQGWENVRAAHLALLAEAVEAARRRPYPAGRWAGRGVVISTHARPSHTPGKPLPQGYFPGAWACLSELRRLGCTLPVQLAYLGEAELDPAVEKLVEPLGATCVDLTRLAAADPMRVLNGWESKVFAVEHAPWDEVLYLDSDCLPVRDPTYLFDSPQVRHYGAAFWPDLPPPDRAEWLPAVCWENAGMPAMPDYVDFETGQFLVDKRLCWRELAVARHLNEHSDYYYAFVFGDKSTFHLAWARCLHEGWGRGWAMPAARAHWNGRHIEQHDFAGRRLFQHTTQDKPPLAGYRYPHLLAHRAAVEGHLAALRARWSGVLWENPDPTPAERALQAELMAGEWVYERVGLGARRLRFLADDRVGRGLARCEVTWTAFDRGPGGPRLVVKDIDGAPTFAARRGPDGAWRGRWFAHEKCEVVLRRPGPGDPE